MARDERRRGEFILLEILIVVGMISVLLAIAVPNFFATSRRIKEERTKSNMRSVQIAIVDLAESNHYRYTVNPDSIRQYVGEALKNPFDKSLSALILLPQAPDDNALPTAAMPSGCVIVSPDADSGYVVSGMGAKSLIDIRLIDGR